MSTRPGGGVRALPANETIAAVARMNASRELKALGLDGALADDALLMVSELATNAYQHTARSDDGQMRPAAGAELWMYRRLTTPTGRPELVIAVFDQGHQLPRPHGGGVDLDAESGRGLMLVQQLTQGRWGTYRTRSQLAPTKSGKVTWIGVPLSSPASDEPQQWEQDGIEAARVLLTLLSRRGFNHVLLQSTSGLAVLSMAGLTVWCRDGHFRWDSSGQRRRVPIADVTAVAEEIVHLHEATNPGGAPA